MANRHKFARGGRSGRPLYAGASSNVAKEIGETHGFKRGGAAVGKAFGGRAKGKAGYARGGRSPFSSVSFGSHGPHAGPPHAGGSSKHAKGGAVFAKGGAIGKEQGGAVAKKFGGPAGKKRGGECKDEDDEEEDKDDKERARGGRTFSELLAREDKKKGRKSILGPLSGEESANLRGIAAQDQRDREERRSWKPPEVTDEQRQAARDAYAAVRARKIQSSGDEEERARGGRMHHDGAPEGAAKGGMHYIGGKGRRRRNKGGHVDVYETHGGTHHWMDDDHSKAKGGAAGGNWIAGAIRKPGALHKELGVPEGEKIPARKLAKAAASDNPKLAKRANLAETLKGLHH